MFKKKCVKCGEKINKNFDFCPVCGLNQKSKYDKEDFGLLGKNDIIEEPLFNTGNSFIEKMFETAFKVLDKQIKHLIKKPKNIISEDRLKQISRLPREEPSSKLKRMSGKIIYELNVPGVRNIEDIIINKLENSVEIKALAEDKVYSKTLNIKLPVLGYKLSDGNL